MSSPLEKNVHALVVVAMTTLAACAQVSNGALPPPTSFDFSGQDFGFVMQFDAFPGSNDDFSQQPVDLAGADLAGPHVQDLAHAPDLTMAPACTVDSLKVNEVQTDGDGGASDEWVEIYNPCSATVSMAGATVVYRATSSTTDVYTLYAFGSAETMAAKAYYLIVNINGYTGLAVPDAEYTAGGLAVGGGGVGLRDTHGTLVDSMGYGTATNAFVETAVSAAPPSASSASRSPDGKDTNDNAKDFVVGNPTPGAANSP